MSFEQIKRVFDEYVSQFITLDERKEEKIYHTEQVAKLSYLLAYKLGLDEEKKELAKLIGYLHDIGRFPQLVETKSFKDINYDHADKGVEVLFNEGLIRRFIQDDKYDNIIKFSVMYHNKFSLPDQMTNDEELFGKLIRDTDKIDIYRVFSSKTTNEFLLPPGKKALEAFMNGASVNIKDKTNKTDTTLCVIAFINDINFQESLDILNELGHFDRYLESINVSEENKIVFNEIKEVCKVRKKVKKC